MADLSSISKPLSLEDLCLLHLVCHLEEHLPERLASLPLHLRQKLLLNLPAADIFQLENTAVTAGIDMEEMVWNVLDDKRSLSYRDDAYSFESSKRTLLTRLCSYIINCNLDGARQVLFSAYGCLDIPDWKDVQHHFAPIGFGPGLYYNPTPRRHVRHFQTECQQMYLMSCLVDGYQRVPVALSVNCRSVTHSDLWKGRHSIPTAVLLKKFLGRIEQLELSQADQVGQFVLEQTLSNQKRTLKHLKYSLSLNHAASMCGVAQLFSPPSQSVGVFPRVSAVLRRALRKGSDLSSAHSSLPYRGLSSIEVSMVTYSDTIDHHLRSVIEYQNSLSSVKLHVSDILGAAQPSIPMVNTLSSLFHQLQFKNLTLGGFIIPWNRFTIIMSQFLSAPSGDQEKVLCFDNLVVAKRWKEDIVDSASTTCTAGVCGDPLPRKALILSMSGMDVPPDLLSSLSAYNYTDLLGSLTVTGSRYPVYPTEAVLPTTTMLQHLHFSDVCLALQLSPDRFFINLFGSPHIKSVRLDSCLIAVKGLLPALTRGLRQQTSVGSLEELRLIRNNLASAQESELREFFDAVFSLPQLQNLELNLRYNYLGLQHLAIMHESWRRNAVHAKKQLKRLLICDFKSSRNDSAHPVFYDHQLELKDIASSGDFVEGYI